MTRIHLFPTLTNGVHTGPGMSIQWQIGPLEQGVNGATPDLVIRALIERFEEFQRTVPCGENYAAIVSLRAILDLMDKRTADRYRRGVMGSEEK